MEDCNPHEGFLINIFWSRYLRRLNLVENVSPHEGFDDKPDGRLVSLMKVWVVNLNIGESVLLKRRLLIDSHQWTVSK